MASINIKPVSPVIQTHEGGRAARITPEQELRRSVMACLLWEDSFYESGESIADRIKALIPQVPASTVAAMAVEARSRMNLRHVPLLLCRELARNKALKADTLEEVIQRADELAEFLAIYWKDGRQPLSAQVKKGLAKAFQKFNEYALAKYNHDGAVKLKDVLFLCHAKPKDAKQDALWKRLIVGELQPPDTWEVALSSGADKLETWHRLLAEKKLGALALLRNLRNMEQAKVQPDVIKAALHGADVRRVLPFRFIAAARYAPTLEADLEACLFRSLEESPKMSGDTIVLVDVSGSMDVLMSAKSDLTRIDAACGLAMTALEICESARIFSFSTTLVEIPARRGMALRDAIKNSQPHASTMLAAAIASLPSCARLIVISDEQAQDDIKSVKADRAYMLNVAAFKNGVGYGGKWTNISGFSEAVVRYILEIESATPTASAGGTP